uniref:Uncharacterized protein n=1 Tax=Arundo donax TaxID=35708 RepID=A0A0A9ARR6_ARUDO
MSPKFIIKVVLLACCLIWFTDVSPYLVANTMAVGK